MSGMQKPFGNEGPKGRVEPVAPPPPAKKGGFFGKLLKLIVFLLVVGLLGSMAWHGKKLGEDKARAKKAPGQTDEQALATATVAWPWQWSTPEWEGWWKKVRSFGSDVGTAVTQKTSALRDEIAKKLEERKKTSAAGATTASTPPKSPISGSTTLPATGGAPVVLPPLSPEAEKAHKLVDEASTLWEKHDFPAAKAKLTEAMAMLKPLSEKQPVHPTVAEDMKLAHDLLEDIGAR